MSAPLRLSDLDGCAALLSQGAARFRRAEQSGPDGLVIFELDAEDNAAEILGKFAAGSLVGNLPLFAREQRELRRVLRTAQRGGRR